MFITSSIDSSNRQYVVEQAAQNRAKSFTHKKKQVQFYAPKVA